MALVIGPARIADSRGTYEPGDIIEYPSAALVALADSKTVDPDSGKLLIKPVSAAAVAAAAAAAPDPTPPPAIPDPTPEKPS